MLDRFAGDFLKGGLVGSLLGGKDFTQGVIPGLIGNDLSGGLSGLVARRDVPTGIIGTTKEPPVYSPFGTTQDTSLFGLDPAVAEVFGKAKGFGHYGIMS